jgi:hypothetical protein
MPENRADHGGLTEKTCRWRAAALLSSKFRGVLLRREVFPGVRRTDAGIPDASAESP